MKQITPEKAKIKAEDYCAKAEHCESEVRDKLSKWGISISDAQQIINALKADRYIDDARFARAFARDKVRFAHWGLRKVRQALQLKRIAQNDIQEAIAAIDMEEYIELITHNIQTKAKNDAEMLTTYEGRTRLFRFAVSRGYEPDLVSKAIKSLIKP